MVLKDADQNQYMNFVAALTMHWTSNVDLNVNNIHNFCISVNLLLPTRDFLVQCFVYWFHPVIVSFGFKLTYDILVVLKVAILILANIKKLLLHYITGKLSSVAALLQ